MTLIAGPLKAELEALYGAADRHYHGLAHIKELLRLAAEYHRELADPDAVEAAIWFHDVVYDSRRADNELRSAALAGERLASRVEPKRLRHITGMIEATAGHALPDFDDPAALRDAALFLDMDLSILGAPPHVFDAYEAGVRREYDWVSEADWRTGRRSVLQRFLSREHIFHTDIFRTACETKARENLSRSLARL
ncbi:HD domain-containing protein [Mesorhizobium sp. 1B3]|uniref:HD domain-containing protein n=1 Tax=Mesorhizobium sp. 1B3 TaxID=3243599 RepID=UPI003D9809F6